MKVLSTEGLTKLIDLIKSSFISNADTEEVTEIDTETVSEVTLATVATTGSYNDLSGKPTVDQTYDGTSANAQSGVAVASAISGKADDNAVVHLEGTETVSGYKVFSSQNITVSNPNIERGVLPNNYEYMCVNLVDKDITRLGLIECDYAPSGDVNTYLGSYSANTGDFSALGLYFPFNGSPYATAPASDVNGSIVTTVSKSKSGNGYFKLGNGLIVQWGYAAFSSQQATVTFPTSFSGGDTYRFVALRRAGSTTTNDGGQIFSRSRTATTIDIYASSSATGNCDWIAIGY